MMGRIRPSVSSHEGANAVKRRFLMGVNRISRSAIVWEFTMNRQKLGRLAIVTGAAGASFLPVLSHAALDVTAATAGISDAQTAVLAVIAAMLTMGIAVWGVKKVLRFFK